jgi:ribosomal-protein-alanine N-acetyltransferase
MEPQGVVIWKMEMEDLGQVLSIEAFSPTPWSERMFSEELRNPLTQCFTLKDGNLSGNPMIGFICFRNIDNESELLKIAVHPQHRGSGIGRKLMQFYVDFCEQIKIASFYLEVNTSNAAAIRLYQSFSFRPAGVRKKFYQGKFDALLMVRETGSR